MTKIKLILGDSLQKLKELEENSVDSIVTDPPYGLSFMGKKWDYDVPSTELWAEAMRVLKPGGHLLSFAGSRTYHRMAVNIEDAGFEIRDQIMWVYGSGFPKSHNIGKSVDKLQGNERKITGEKKTKDFSHHNGSMMGKQTTKDNKTQTTTIRATKGNSPHEGWGTALKPAHEPIVVARKPLLENTVAKNVLKYGTGGINIDGCRVGTEEITTNGKGNKFVENNPHGQRTGESVLGVNITNTGRFPANFIHDGSDEVVGLFPNSKGAGKSLPQVKVTGYGENIGQGKNTYLGGERTPFNNGEGSAARFFYCAKASKKDRNDGLEEFEEKQNVFNGQSNQSSREMKGVENKFTTQPKKNFHPTVKPTALMQYLVRLVTPKGGTVLDPFMGSGSTGKACARERFDFIGIDLDPEYVKIAQARIDNELNKYGI